MPTKNRKQSIKNTQGSESLEFISLADAAKFCAYSQDYLSLRARQGKLRAEKHGRNWVTTKEWLWEYLDSTAHSSKKNESLQVTLEKKIPTKTIDSSAQVYYDLKESSRDGLGKLASKVSEAQKPLGRAFSMFSRGLHRVVFAILENLNVFVWMLPKRLETVPVKKVTSWASLFVIAWFVVWSSQLHTVIVNELAPRHEAVVVTTENATGKVLGYAETQFQKTAAFYGSFIDSSYSFGTLARSGNGEVLGVSESDFVEGQYGRLERLSRIVNSEQLQTETENNSKLTQSSIQTGKYARTGLIGSLQSSVRNLRNGLARFINSNNERVHVLGSLFHTLHLTNDAFVRPLMVSSIVPDAIDSAAYSRLAQSFSSLKLSFGDSELEVITDHESQEQHIGSAFSTLFIGQQGEVVNLNTADQYNFSKIGTLGNDLLLQPSSGYVVKIGEADARHLSEQKLFEGELTGERSLLVSGMLEVQKPAFIDVTSREGALVLRQGGDGNLITGYNNFGEEVFSVSNDGIISAQGLSDNLATTKILQTQSPSLDSLTVANLTVTDSADVENLTVRGLFSADNLTVEDTLTVNDQLDVLGSLSVDTDTLVVDAVNDLVRTGDLEVTGDETIDGSLTVFGPTNLAGPTVIDGDLIVNGSIIGGNISQGTSPGSGNTGTVQNIVRYIDEFGDHVLFTDVNVSGLLGVGYLGVGHSADFDGDVTIGTDTGDVLTINSTTNINGPVTIASPYDLTVGGDVTVGGSLTVDSFTSNGTSTFATTTFDGVISLKETNAPSATADYGKLYVKSSDSSLYFLNDSGTEFNLLLGGGGSGSGLWTTSTDSLLVRPIDTSDVVLIGGSATTTSGFQFEVIGSSLLDNATLGGQLTVEGTGTSTIAGDTNFDSGVLYIDSLSDKVGLGTTSPLALLTVGSSTPDKIAAFNRYNSAFVAGVLEVDGVAYLDGGLETTNITSTNATTTSLAVTGQASSTYLTVSNGITIGNYSLPIADGSANYVLKTDGSGNVTWQADTTGGSGSINQLGQVGDVTTSTLAYGNVLTWNGSGWVDTATSSLAIDLANTIGTLTKTQIANSGTLSFDWTDAEVADALTIDGGTID
ncbi:MAG: beta strand repeat-containing protein, partial [Patescibacteria group bacterium]